MADASEERPCALLASSSTRSWLAVSPPAAAASTPRRSQTRCTTPDPICSPEELVLRLASDYRCHDFADFETHFHPDSQYLSASDPASTGLSAWLRHQHELFDSAEAIDVLMSRLTEFVERVDLYRSPSNPKGLDPSRWKAPESAYGTHFFYQMRGDLDYAVDGRSNLVVLEDRALSACSPDLVHPLPLGGDRRWNWTTPAIRRPSVRGVCHSIIGPHRLNDLATGSSRDRGDGLA